MFCGKSTQHYSIESVFLRGAGARCREEKRKKRAPSFLESRLMRERFRAACLCRVVLEWFWRLKVFLTRRELSRLSRREEREASERNFVASSSWRFQTADGTKNSPAAAAVKLVWCPQLSMRINSILLRRRRRRRRRCLIESEQRMRELFGETKQATTKPRRQSSNNQASELLSSHTNQPIERRLRGAAARVEPSQQLGCSSTLKNR